jgi:endonuclease/exonuclease/phosphatase family metal-dependent hydrolase
MPKNKAMKSAGYQRNPMTSPDKSSIGSRRIRVLTYNIHSCVDQNRTVNCDKFVKIIEELNPDIVALQEVNAQRPFDKNRNQAGIIADKLKMDYIFFPAEDAGLRAFGLALLSRFSFIESHYNLLPNLYPRLNPRKRGAVRVSLQTPAGPLHVINVHLSLFKLERRKQVKTLLGRDWLAAVPTNEPAILCGDMNAGPLSKTYHTLSRHLTDVQKEIKSTRGAASQPTFHSRSPLFRIDHIFVSGHFRILNVEAIKTPDTQIASDHLPLTADLAIS